MFSEWGSGRYSADYITREDHVFDWVGETEFISLAQQKLMTDFSTQKLTFMPDTISN